MTEEVITVVIDIEDTKRRLAYDLWEKAGQPEGQADGLWLEACRIVEAEMAEPDWLKRYAAEAKAEAEVTSAKRARRAA
jgi:hypothetical protein